MEETIQKVIGNAERSNKPCDGDYYVGDILYCGKCKTPKQCYINAFNKALKVPCVCKCRKAELDAEEAERKRIKRLERIEWLRSEGFPEKRMLEWNFDNDDMADAETTKKCKKYVEKFDEFRKVGKGLLLYGTVGTGKTFHASCIVNALIDKGIPCLMTNFARVSNELQSNFNGKQEYLDNLNRYELIVIDDLGAERDTEYMNEIVYNIIDSRYRSGKPMIITTNLTAEELKHPKDISQKRYFSRIFEMAILVEVNGKDRRKQEFCKTFDTYQQMLNE